MVGLREGTRIDRNLGSVGGSCESRDQEGQERVQVFLPFFNNEEGIDFKAIFGRLERIFTDRYDTSTLIDFEIGSIPFTFVEISHLLHRLPSLSHYRLPSCTET